MSYNYTYGKSGLTILQEIHILSISYKTEKGFIVLEYILNITAPHQLQILTS